VSKTFVNGHLVYDEGQFDPNFTGEVLLFDRVKNEIWPRGVMQGYHPRRKLLFDR